MTENKDFNAHDEFEEVKRTFMNRIADAIRVSDQDATDFYHEVHMAVDYNAGRWGKRDALAIIEDAPVTYGDLDQSVIQDDTLHQHLSTAAFEAMKWWLLEDDEVKEIEERIIDDDTDDREAIKVLIESAVSGFGGDDAEGDD